MSASSKYPTLSSIIATGLTTVRAMPEGKPAGSLFKIAPQDLRNERAQERMARDFAARAVLAQFLGEALRLRDHGGGYDAFLGGYLREAIGARPTYGDEPEMIEYDEPAFSDISEHVRTAYGDGEAEEMLISIEKHWASGRAAA